MENSIAQPCKPNHKLHSRVGTLGIGRTPEDQDYYHSIVDALKGMQKVLVVGPAQAKLQLIKHIHSHAPALVSNIVGIEAVDHPTDGQLVVYARKYFLAKDRMLP